MSLRLGRWKWAATVAILSCWITPTLKPADFEIVAQDQIEFIWVPEGTFIMGTSDQDRACLIEQKLWTRFNECERPPHPVTISKPFLLSRFEITQKQWKAITGKNPSAFKGDLLPVDSASWEEVQEFIHKLNQRANLNYRLPTEAEWEYCCRAGSPSFFGLGKDYASLSTNQIADHAWSRADSHNRTHPVGEKLPNAWGFYDMHGNLWEWCQDWFSADYYATSAGTDPVNRQLSTERVLRGGSWFLDWINLRTSARSGSLPTSKSQYVGFRLACDCPAEQ